MARPRTSRAKAGVRLALARRLVELRTEMYGEHGAPTFARHLKAPIRTWYQYERGRIVPGQVILRVIEVTHAEPMWLLYGTGPKYRRDVEWAFVQDDGRTIAADLIRIALALTERGISFVPDEPT